MRYHRHTLFCWPLCSSFVGNPLLLTRSEATARSKGHLAKLSAATYVIEDAVNRARHGADGEHLSEAKDRRRNNTNTNNEAISSGGREDKVPRKVGGEPSDGNSGRAPVPSGRNSGGSIAGGGGMSGGVSRPSNGEQTQEERYNSKRNNPRLGGSLQRGSEGDGIVTRPSPRPDEEKEKQTEAEANNEEEERVDDDFEPESEQEDGALKGAISAGSAGAGGSGTDAQEVAGQRGGLGAVAGENRGLQGFNVMNGVVRTTERDFQDEIMKVSPGITTGEETRRGDHRGMGHEVDATAALDDLPINVGIKPDMGTPSRCEGNDFGHTKGAARTRTDSYDYNITCDYSISALPGAAGVGVGVAGGAHGTGGPKAVGTHPTPSRYTGAVPEVRTIQRLRGDSKGTCVALIHRLKVIYTFGPRRVGARHLRQVLPRMMAGIVHVM